MVDKDPFPIKEYRKMFGQVRRLVNELTGMVDEEIAEHVDKFGDISLSTVGSGSVRTIPRSQSRIPESDAVKKLRFLYNIRSTLESLKNKVMNYYFTSDEFHKDSSIADIYQQLCQQTVKMGLCKIYCHAQMNHLKHENLQRRTEQALVFIKEFVEMRLEHGRRLLEIEDKPNLPKCKMRQDQIGIVCEDKAIQEERDKRDDTTQSKVQQNVTHEQKGLDLHFGDDKTKSAPNQMEEGKTNTGNLENKTHEDALKEMYFEQCKKIEITENLLEIKRTKLEAKRTAVLQRCNIASQTFLGFNVKLANQVQDLREENARLLFEYMCQRKEITAVLNHLQSNTLDPNYKEKGYRGLDPVEEASVHFEVMSDVRSLESLHRVENEDAASLHFSDVDVDDVQAMDFISIQEMEDEASNAFSNVDSGIDFAITSSLQHSLMEAADSSEEEELKRLPQLKGRVTWFNVHRTEHTERIEQELLGVRQKIQAQRARLKMLPQVSWQPD